IALIRPFTLQGILHALDHYQAIQCRFAGKKSCFAPMFIVRGMTQEPHPCATSNECTDTRGRQCFVVTDCRRVLREMLAEVAVRHKEPSRYAAKRDKPLSIGKTKPHRTCPDFFLIVHETSHQTCWPSFRVLYHSIRMRGRSFGSCLLFGNAGFRCRRRRPLFLRVSHTRYSGRNHQRGSENCCQVLSRHVLSLNSNRRRQCPCFRDLRNRNNVFPPITAKNWFLRHNDRVSRTYRAREHVSGPETALPPARHGSICADDENRALVRKLCRTSRAREIPTGASSRRVRESIGVVYLADHQHRSRLLGNRQRIVRTKLDVVWRAFKILAVGTNMNDESARDRGLP